MLIYIVRRLLWVVVLLFVITLLTFVIFNVLPAGDPAALRAGRQPSAELIASIREQLGLDDPYPVQFVRYIGQILPFVGGDGVNFGFSYQNNAEVLPQILSRIPATMFLTGGAVVVWLAVAIPVGLISAVRSGSVLDRLSMGIALVAISAPVYFLGLIALYLFADDIGRFPILPGNSAYQEADSLPEKAFALVMPWCVLAAAFAAIYARFLRGSMIETLQEDYIRTARAKGVSERRVIFHHGMRSALTPIVTVLGLDVGILVGGAILTESVFNIPGIGRLTYDAIQVGDIVTVQGATLFLALAVCIANLFVDIMYSVLDPRVRLS
jgi:peptide/nickel transport system permease protein